MQITIKAPGHVEATVILPSSKSISNRVLVMNGLSKMKAPVFNVSDCDDTRVMVRAFKEDGEIVDVMAAGTAMRFLTAFYAASSGKVKLMTGTPRMQQRPIKVLVDALSVLGADITYVQEEGFPPILVKGKELQSAVVELSGGVSSQYISALLMIGPKLKDGLRLKLKGDIISRPYINLTMSLMRDFGAEVGWVADDEIEVCPKEYASSPFTVESDWSAASYWYEIVALSEDSSACVVLPALWETSYQGDSAVAKLFSRLGVMTEYDEKERQVILKKGGTCVERFDYDFVNQPDLVQTFAVTCCLLDVPFRFEGVQSLRIKETDRISALVNELAKLGYRLCAQNDSVLSWDGERLPAGKSRGEIVFDTYEDHRMAMALAPACLKVGEVKMNEPGVVSKSYPHFWEDLKKVGFEVVS